ncbi:lipid kinase [Stutzerimonas kirkiae]|uniref:Lipid kinase n=2 Tax=Stutzerimonas kirkiae TaxID=2211392 RepID=A0A4Q9R809_9GAMM|nr:lipid kinase [Stutzerimonas kirkiae]TBV02208.1 lipid kinase [Stutzerimonas kirkiae]TBV08882.1 lipid kinase [Stutzerimonas kirkiae]TBV15862.1 lipid kinase [Stutzerimonas kirkiae]
MSKHLAVAILGVLACSAQAAEPFRLAWSLYPAYMPWDYASRSGIVDKWAKKYGIEIEVVQVNDYVEAINQYSAGGFDACMMATMDALTIPAAAGVDSTVLSVVDYSNGNDVIILKDGESLQDLKGKKINLIEYSISHYFLARALQTVGMSERDVTLVNTSDADMLALYAQPSIEAMVTWNPMASAILERDDARNVFDSRKMPGELTDSIIVNTRTLEEHPALGKALIGAWFETLAIMQRDDEQGRLAREAMGQAAGTDLEGYERQLQATHLYDQPAGVVDLMAGAELQDSMASIARFSFDKGLLGNGAASAEAIGIAYPGGKVWGDRGNVKLRFDDRYTGMAANGEL